MLVIYYRHEKLSIPRQRQDMDEILRYVS